MTIYLFSQFSDPNSTEIQSLATDFAILDIQWTPHSELVGGNLLAVATSTGILAFYRLQQQQEQQQQPPKLVLSHVQHITDDDTTLVLSLTWHPVRAGVLGLTLSDGRVCVCTSTSMGTGSGSGSGSTEEDDTAAGLWSQDAAVSLQDVHEHELEAWMMTFTPESLNVLSGGDDMVLQCSHVADDDGDDDDESEEDAEQEEDKLEDEQHIQKTNKNKNKTNLLWQNRKLHHAGITAILPLSETLVLTGSYDDHIRLLQLPKIPGDTRPKLLAELNLGGGVWRLKLLTTGRASSSSSSQQDDDSTDAAENKSSSDSTVSALRRSCSSSSITRYALPSFCRCCCSTSTSTSSIHILFLSNVKNKNLFFAPVSLIRAGINQSVSQPACLDCCRDATRMFLFFLY